MTPETPERLSLRQPGAWRVLARCLSYLRPYWPYVAGAYVVLVVNNGITLAMPLVIRAIVDRGIAVGDTGTIGRGTAALFAMALVRGLFIFLGGRWSEVASRNVAFDLRNSL